MGELRAWGGAVVGLLLLACGGPGPGAVGPVEVPDGTPLENPGPDGDPQPISEPPPPTPPDQPPPETKPVAFQTAFSMALRWSTDPTGLVTHRLKVPVTRGGSRLRFSFRAGDGDLHLVRATVARFDPSLPTGALGSAPVELSFDGKPDASASARERLVSDPLVFPVKRFEELLVSFEVEGSLSRSAITLLPGSVVGEGAHADAVDAFGAEDGTPVGLVAIDVEGPREPTLVVIGDSITEGYVGYAWDDYRDSWGYRAALATGMTVNNAAVSGQGVVQALANVESEVFPLTGLTDCLVLLGTNDVAFKTVEQEAAALSKLYDRLRPHCDVWAATLPPRERIKPSGQVDTQPELDAMWATRTSLNAWLRTDADVKAVIDFAPVLSSPEDANHFLPGFGEDGVHPTVRGQHAMGDEAARVIRATFAPN